MPGYEDAVSRVVARPVLVQEAAFGFQSTKQWGVRIRSEDVKSRALKPLLLDPVCEVLKSIGLIMIEAQNKAAVHLNAIPLENGDSSGIVSGLRTALASCQ